MNDYYEISVMLTEIAIVCEKSIFIVVDAQHLVRNIDCMNTVAHNTIW